jgi:long-subunit acyl-CoA synthetase (AMP-forming)
MDSGAKALITTVEHLPIAKEACKKVGISDEFIALAGEKRDPAARIKHFTSVRNISGATRYRKTKVDPQKDLAFLVYSSGTTGKPKGVMLSHSNIVANILQIAAGETPLDWKGGPNNEGDKILAFLPFFHIYGMYRFDRNLQLRLVLR